MLEPVYDQKSHRRALRRIEALWDADPGSPEARELDALATLVDAYEKTQFPILPPDPVEAIRARCEELGWTRKQLEPLIGSRARVSEILGRQRTLTLSMIRRLHAALGIPAEILVGDSSGGSKKSRARSTKRAGRRRAPQARTTRKPSLRSRSAKQQGSNTR